MDYYFNLIKNKGRNELQVFEVADFTLINSIDFEDATPVTFVWTKNDQLQHELVGLLKHESESELVYISPIIGITDRTVIEDDVTDICISDGQLFGCFHGGLINFTTNKRFKPNKKFDIIEGSSGKLYLSDGTKVYTFTNSRLSEVKVQLDSNVNQINTFDDILVVVTNDGLIVNDKFVPGAVNYKMVDGKQFMFYPDKVVIDEDVIISLKDVVEVIKVNEQYKFIYKLGNSVKSTILVLETQTVDTTNSTNGTNGTYDNLNGNTDVIDIDTLIPSTNNLSVDTLYTQVLNNLETPHELIKTVQANNDETTIKTLSSKFTTEQQSVILNIIVSQITKSPLNSKTLSIWFKVFVSSNPQLISTIPQKKTNSLSKHLTSSLDILPDLLSIKGKLHLIKMQNHFKQLDIHTDLQNETEDSVVIANGENDDEFEQ